MANTKPNASQVRYGNGTTVDTVLKKTTLSYATDIATQDSATTLPNGQLVFSDESGTSYTVNSGSLIVKSREQRNVRSRITSVPDAQDYEHLVVKIDPLDPMTWNWWPAFRAALDTGASSVTCLKAGVHRITDQIDVNQARQRLRLGEDTTLLLDNADVSKRVVKLVGAKSRVSGGVIESVIRRNFLVECAGQKSKAKNLEVTHATPPGMWPYGEGNPNFPYNKGGIALTGLRAEAIKNEVSNLFGIGIISYAGGQNIEHNDTHHNTTGIHVDHADSTNLTTLAFNKVEDNDSLGMLANRDGVLLAVFLNTIRGNGSHGGYLRCHRSMVGVNFAYDNYGDGLKVRDANGTVVYNNSAFRNNTSNNTSGAELRLQINDNGASDVSFFGNMAQSTDTSKTQSYSVAFAGTSRVNQRFSFIGNMGENARLAHSDKLLCVANSMSGTLFGDVSGANYPTSQSNGIFANNQAAVFSTTGNFKSNVLMANMFGKLVSTTTGGNLNNRVLMNHFYNQDVQFERRFFKEFNYNFAQMALSSAIPATRQANNAADNSYKRMIANQFANATGGIIQDSTSTVSGSYNTIVANTGDNPAGSFQMFGMWGTGHTFANNVNIGGGDAGYVGCTNSWLIGNSPKFVTRPEGTGNQNI